MKRRKLVALFGYFIFFITVAFIITSAVLIYGCVSEMEKPVIAAIMLVVIIVLALLCTIIDGIRRKFMVERPVRKILLATKKITEGDFSFRVIPNHSYDGYDDYDLIMENINIMVEELAKNEVLRNDFVANVSHEIKTPLSIISNYATALQNDALPADMRAEYTKTLIRASKRLSDLITNILKLNKLENQEIYPDKMNVNVGESLRKSILQFEELTDSKRIEVECDINDAMLFTDESFLEIIWNNLLSNAIKFTPYGGKISISLQEDQTHISVSVRDTGCGMSKETGERVFDKFYQGDTSHAQQGNGLGLTLVKKVVDILGGEIEVTSVLGKGSNFTIRLRKED